ncbi:GGDEF domain-containing protein [Desulforhabdus amnigena]|uniref:diguanylate cyclase n=1 Tax=Desulforhabdus amnigena TaxID=40218 RepID=A0A9W6D3K1_9BACT|nr:GGDEF domain-containing protein [Desulforhabdus amnigena]GLI33552.1 hypothetical protein DAMNIGENAA_09850 [Desulforhabdus amnigena]
MGRGQDSQELGKNMGRLSEIVIEALKEISAQRRPLASSSLCQALSAREDVFHLISEISCCNGLSLQCPDQTKAELKTMKNEILILKSQKERLFNHVIELQEEKEQLQTFYRRSLSTFLTWIQASANDSLYCALNDFKSLLFKDTDLADLEKSLSNIKEIFVKLGEEDLLPPAISNHSSPVWGRLFKKAKDLREPGEPGGLYLKELQEIYLDVLQVVTNDLGKRDVNGLSELQQKIKRSADPSQLFSIKKDILAFIEFSIKSISEERKQIAQFISEINENLVQMESHLFSSLNGRRQAHQANADFNLIIETQMDDMKRSMDVSTDLGELKKLVITKIATIRSALEMKRREDEKRLAEAHEQLGGLQKKIENVKTEIDQIQERARNLEREAFIDPLTNIHNRRAYEQRLKEEFQRYTRYGQVFSMLLLDVDDFKNVNDSYGHAAGDLCLKEVINKVKGILRVSDFLSRYGGDEFVVILPGTDREAMKKVAEKIHSSIEKTRFFYQGKQIIVRISVGGTQVEPLDQKEEDVFDRADRALYEAKTGGRNNVLVL